MDFPSDIGDNFKDIIIFYILILASVIASSDFDEGVEMKATLLAVTFLIDYLHFEADPGDSDGEGDFD